VAPSPAELVAHLRAAGVTVHHAAPAADGSPKIVVFLEALLGQDEEAESHARQLAGVSSVAFLPETRAVMLVRVG
jgi:dienelactone hydrolase